MLAEAIREGTAPAALILQESDEIIVLGAIVADEIYGVVMPILIVDDATYAEVAAADTAPMTTRPSRSRRMWSGDDVTIDRRSGKSARRPTDFRESWQSRVSKV